MTVRGPEANLGSPNRQVPPGAHTASESLTRTASV